MHGAVRSAGAVSQSVGALGQQQERRPFLFPRSLLTSPREPTPHESAPQQPPSSALITHFPPQLQLPPTSSLFFDSNALLHPTHSEDQTPPATPDLRSALDIPWPLRLSHRPPPPTPQTLRFLRAMLLRNGEWELKTELDICKPSPSNARASRGASFHRNWAHKNTRTNDTSAGRAERMELRRLSVDPLAPPPTPPLPSRPSPSLRYLHDTSRPTATALFLTLAIPRNNYSISTSLSRVPTVA